MSLSHAINDFLGAKLDLKDARDDLEKAQGDCDGTWGYYLQDQYEAVDTCEKHLEEERQAIDTEIDIIVEEKISELLKKI